MSLIKKESFIVVEEKVLCKKCNKNERRSYHSWCGECFNEYRSDRMEVDKELGSGDYIYFIVNTKTGIICYTGKSNSLVVRYKSHLEWLTSNFGKMLRATGGDPSDYSMYVMDLTELKLTKAELRAVEHQHNYRHRDTVINTDIQVTTKDADIIEDLKYRGLLDKIDELEWTEYNEFIHKKKTINLENDSTLENEI